MSRLATRRSALRSYSLGIALSCILLTVLVVVALLFFSEFGGGSTGVIYGEF